MPSYKEQLALPAWWLVDEHRNVIASFRAATALEARDEFRRNGLSGARVVRAEVAPVDPDAVPAGMVCEQCGDPVVEATGYRLVTGWERISRNGAGGTHAIRAPDRSAQRFMCMFCINKLADGVSPQQQALLVPGPDLGVR
jgi:hypothetical protein